MKVKKKIWQAANMDESFLHALRGLLRVFKTQKNFRIIILIGLFSILLGLYFNIGIKDLIILIISAAILLVSEIFNSIVEEFGDFAEPKFHPVIKRIKDISAAAVLVAVGIFLVINFLIFIAPLSGILKL